MAKVRIGFGTHFEVENERIGIGTDSSLSTLHVTGDIISKGIESKGGITTFVEYAGFIDKEATVSQQTIDLNYQAHSLSGEINVDGNVIVSAGTTLTSGPEDLTVTDNFTLPGINDDKPTLGTIRFNENLGAIQVFVGGPEEPPIAGAGGSDSPYFPRWKTVSSIIDSGNMGRAVFVGGADASSNLKTIDYFSVISKGNAVRWNGETMATESRRSGCGSKTRGLSAGSDDASNHELIEYITIASEGNTSDFGDLFNGRGTCAGFSSSSRGIWAGGRTPTSQDTIDSVEIASLGDAQDFGDIRNARQWVSGCSSPTRGIIAGGEGPAYASPTRTRHIEYVTIASKGNSILFGDMTAESGGVGACSNSVRGFFGGGEPRNWSKIDMITIASTGNAIQFGDLQQRRIIANGAASQTRGFIFGGQNNPPGVYVNLIESIEIASSGNAVEWGDLTHARWAGASISDCHGGLGGN